MVGGRIVQPGATDARRRPRVSVVIPCYNYARYLPAAVASALDQRNVDVDVVIVDDASTDDSHEVAAALADREPRIRVVRHARNAGHVETSNEALSLATGEYVVKLDADDMLAPGALARSTALMQTFPGVVFVYGKPVAFQDDPPGFSDAAASSWTVWSGERWTARLLRRGRNVIMQPEVTVRRDAVEASGGYRTQLRWAEDYNWWMRLAALGDVGRVNGVPQGFYRVHGESFQRSADDLELSDLRARVEATELFLSEDAVRDPWPRVARTALLKDARRMTARARERPDGGDAAAREFALIAGRLESELGERRVRGLSASSGPWGSAYRNLEARLAWRRWAKWGM
ncbi:glycosyltransferase family 2 protein [Microbacterium sp. P05]|uniref:glycosyltransferase family 2 protein n=1 Tax=Microbacterium sp. P05 TaxID=3366948 RepID=UPI003746F7A9